MNIQKVIKQYGFGFWATQKGNIPTKYVFIIKKYSRAVGLIHVSLLRYNTFSSG